MSTPPRLAPEALDQAMDAFAASGPALPLAVGFSGGADSSALLLACARRWPGQVVAWHVHHGLQAAGDDFEAHCRQVCQRWGIPLHVQAVDAQPAAGQSPQDAARRARHQAFEQLAARGHAGQAIGTVLLAQHADDQVETLLLALSRGSGLPGLAAMPARWQRGGLSYARPLLSVPGPALRAWLQAHGENWIEDPSNQLDDYTRNRIRHELLPPLQALFPHVRDSFGRSAAHAAQAQQLLDELARIDLASTGCPPRIAALQALSPARAANLLRHWLRSQHGQGPSQAQLDELLRQLAACTTRGHAIDLRVGSGRIRRSGDVLVWHGVSPPDTA